MNNDKILTEKLKLFEKLLNAGYNTDKKIMDMKIEEIILLSNFSRSELMIAVEIKQALISKTLISFFSGIVKKD